MAWESKFFNSKNKDASIRRDGEVDPPFGIYNKYGQYILVHLPSGLAFVSSEGYFSTEIEAKLAVARLRCLDFVDWSLEDPLAVGLTQDEIHVIYEAAKGV